MRACHSEKKIKLSLSYGVFSGTCRTFEFHTVKTQEPHTHTHTHRHTTAQPFNGRWSRTTRIGRYQKKHSPTHTHPDHQTSFINFLHLLRSIASSVFSLRALGCPLSGSSLVFRLVLDRLLFTPCISRLKSSCRKENASK